MHPAPLAAGTRLGPYEVISPIGAGGMGDVYRARDTRLGRGVAIKVLPHHLSAHTERLRRFEKESRAASSLNHPNIVTIYDVGTTDSRAYIAMELVEGKTLRELLHKGPVPLRRLLAFAAQIADGLAKAHEAGIVHRDLKPENLMVTGDGFAKILDFGLAKLTQAGEDPAAEDRLATLTRGTEPGLVMGTAGYMSPEQAAGRPLDFRSDQFSFGSILHEMATGTAAFARSTAPETLAAIIREEPDSLGAVAPSAPVPLRWIVERCLAKEPSERYASTRDLARDLAQLRDGLAEAAGSGPSLAAAAPRPFLRRGTLAALLGVLVVGIALFAARRTFEQHPVFQKVVFRRGQIGNARFGPDGQTILYTASFDEKDPQVFSTRLDSPESTRLPLPAASLVSISDTGRLLIALPRGPTDTLAELPLAGGAPREILESPAYSPRMPRAVVPRADFAPGGEGLAVVRRVNDRDRLEFPIGKPLYDPGTGAALTSPRFSPGGDRIAFFEENGSTHDVAVVDLKGKKTTLSRNWLRPSGLAWHPKSGEVWFSARQADANRGGASLHAVSLKGRYRVVSSVPGELLVRDILRDGRVLAAQGDLSTAVMCLPPGGTKEVDLSWFEFSQGKALSEDGRAILLGQGGLQEVGVGAVYLRKTDGSPAVRLGTGYPIALSPDGKWAAAAPTLAFDRLVLLPTGAGGPKELQREGMIVSWAAWSPNGKRIVWAADRPGSGTSLFVQDLDGGSPRSVTPESEGVIVSWATWLPDGKRILLAADRAGQGTKLFVQDADGGAARPVSPEGAPEAVGGWLVSPDGKLVAACDSESTAYLYPIEGGQPRPIPAIKPSDVLIRWDARGEALFLGSSEGQLPIRIDRLELASGRRELWKELTPADRSGFQFVSSVLLTPDGKSYAYTISKGSSSLYVVEGLK